MAKSTRNPAPSASVVSISTARQKRTEKAQSDLTPKSDPYAVMETMIDMYFRALSYQLEELKLSRRKS